MAWKVCLEGMGLLLEDNKRGIGRSGSRGRIEGRCLITGMRC